MQDVLLKYLLKMMFSSCKNTFFLILTEGIITLYIHLPSWILAVSEFGTIGSVDGCEALGSPHHAQHAQHRHSLSAAQCE